MAKRHGKKKMLKPACRYVRLKTQKAHAYIPRTVCERFRIQPFTAIAMLSVNLTNCSPANQCVKTN